MLLPAVKRQRRPRGKLVAAGGAADLDRRADGAGDAFALRPAARGYPAPASWGAPPRPRDSFRTAGTRKHFHRRTGRLDGGLLVVTGFGRRGAVDRRGANLRLLRLWRDKRIDQLMILILVEVDSTNCDF